MIHLSIINPKLYKDIDKTQQKPNEFQQKVTHDTLEQFIQLESQLSLKY